jgi:hypothetical protein
MNARPTTTWTELANRSSDGLDVSFVWAKRAGRDEVVVPVTDFRAGDYFEVPAEPARARRLPPPVRLPGRQHSRRRQPPRRLAPTIVICSYGREEWAGRTRTWPPGTPGMQRLSAWVPVGCPNPRGFPVKAVESQPTLRARYRQTAATHVPTHQRPITRDICPEPRHLQPLSERPPVAGLFRVITRVVRLPSVHSGDCSSADLAQRTGPRDRGPVRCSIG